MQPVCLVVSVINIHAAVEKVTLVVEIINAQVSTGWVRGIQLYGHWWLLFEFIESYGSIILMHVKVYIFVNIT